MRRFAVMLIAWASFLGGVLPSVACAFDICGGCCPAQPSDPAQHTGSGIPGCSTDAPCAVSLTPAISASVHAHHVRSEFPFQPPEPPALASGPRFADAFEVPRLLPRPVATAAETASLTYLRTARLRL